MKEYVLLPPTTQAQAQRNLTLAKSRLRNEEQKKIDFTRIRKRPFRHTWIDTVLDLFR